ncbi:MAG: signal peptidase II [Prochlorococcaceae cyanobacterium MAG_34]|jgi:signal peptidase II|nr:signal peptidase II [Cyanobium sp. MAG_237]MDP4736833.1 signal peptidase II [Cyanobium sp. MAG_216]MDP4807819.1 signal peptidase II [Cyanobium sp. MAG_160]MDP4831749.1 signal peptidase II [Cyanobium sp. MAG_185]MDP4881091.1 signal peptidase II [Cyanobium sp. MAG_137]MDP5119040.1 signal peptidase II [Prochlorococcaceae cyanobacterium MAG_34]MDP5122869.1 signal peptidase II [Cyanobium sp. MAG_04]
MRRLRNLAYTSAVMVLVLDQLSKALAVANLPLGSSSAFLPGLLSLQLVRNSGAAFSLFSGNPQLLGLVSLLVSIAVAVWIQKQGRMTLTRSLGVGLLLGGALGNGLDRWRLGYVVDFLALVPVSFPVFNLADVAINLAVLCFAIELLGNHGQKGV